MAKNITPPRGKNLPELPEASGLHPLRMSRDGIKEEFDVMFAWLKSADSAPGAFTMRQEYDRDLVADRVDLLRQYVHAW